METRRQAGAAVAGAIAVTLGGAAPTIAAELPCDRPGVPRCAAAVETFEAPERLAACQQELQYYVAAVMDYLQCLSDEHVTIGQEMTDTVRRFNCRLMGRDRCE